MGQRQEGFAALDLADVQRALEEAEKVKTIAKSTADPLDGALKLDFETAIPGHGPIMKKADVVKFRNDIVAMRTRVSSAIKGGASQDQVTKLLTSEFGWQEGGMQLRMGGPGMYNELKAAN